MRIAQEEVFGPVLSVIRWNDHEQLIKEANDVGYGREYCHETLNMYSQLKAITIQTKVSLAWFAVGRRHIVHRRERRVPISLLAASDAVT
jgi:aldehyde dehydrogenase (NAD+)